MLGLKTNKNKTNYQFVNFFFFFFFEKINAFKIFYNLIIFVFFSFNMVLKNIQKITNFQINKLLNLTFKKII